MSYIKMRNVFIFIFAAAFLTGCSSDKGIGHTKMVPVHDEVLTYEKPYDLVFLRVEEALERVEGWELESTEKEKGVIVVRNLNFSSFTDADKRTATFWLKRVSSKITSVELAPQSQRIVGGDTLMKHVSEYLDRQKIDKGVSVIAPTE